MGTDQTRSQRQGGTLTPEQEARIREIIREEFDRFEGRILQKVGDVFSAGVEQAVNDFKNDPEQGT